MRTAYIIFTLLLFLGANRARGQEPPPRPLSVYINPLQGLNFGAFFQGATGGSVIIYANGARSVTGDLVQASLGYPFSPAIFEVDADPGTRVSILNGPDVTLSGSNGGSIVLHIGSSDIGSSFITTAIPPSRTQLRIGGTLTVGSALANPSGAYSGTFQLIFMQE
jgi:hypothetical protein